MKSKRLIQALLFIALIGLVSCKKDKQESSNAPVEGYPTTVITPQVANLEYVFPVTISGEDDVEIKPHVDGYIERVFASEGSKVTKGQALFKIDSPSSEQALISSRAAVNSAQAQVNIAKVDVDRFRPLAEKGIVSEVQLLTYENAYQAALAALEQAKASLRNAEATMSWTTVTSPISGIVGPVPYGAGSLVNSSHSLTTVSNTQRVSASFSLNERNMLKLMNFLGPDALEGDISSLPSVKLILSDGSEYEESGKIETISGIIDETTGTANFSAGFPNPNGRIKSGTSGKVIIPREIPNAFVIPQKATFSQMDRMFVFKVIDNVVEQQLITVIPMSNGQDYAVTSGLNEGDRIVSDGVATLRNGMKIAVNQ